MRQGGARFHPEIHPEIHLEIHPERFSVIHLRKSEPGSGSEICSRRTYSDHLPEHIPKHLSGWNCAPKTPPLKVEGPSLKLPKYLQRRCRFHPERGCQFHPERGCQFHPERGFKFHLETGGQNSIWRGDAISIWRSIWRKLPSCIHISRSLALNNASNLGGSTWNSFQNTTPGTSQEHTHITTHLGFELDLEFILAWA